MNKSLLEDLRKIDINNLAENKLMEAREKKTLEEGVAFLTTNLDGEQQNLAIAILKEEFETEMENLESIGIFSKHIDEESEPFTDDPELLKIIIEQNQDKTTEHIKNVLSLLKISKAGSDYVIKEIKKLKRAKFKEEEAKKLKTNPSDSNPSEKGL